ncbi:MAG: alkaline phosphatase family protein [Bacteroidales bacterium]
MRRFVASIVTILSAVQLVAQQLPERPKLVVTITVDQLRSDLLHLFYEAFGESGFKKLMKEGTVCFDLDYDYPNVDKSNSVATIFTGTTPFYHGVISNDIYVKHHKAAQPILYDKEFMGNYSPETVSPRALLTSTIGDELKVATENLSDVYSIAPGYEQALLSAGHAANAAFWIDNTTGRWATSTYYKDAPSFFEQYNISFPLNTKIETASWMPLNAPSFYKFLPFQTRDFGFKYSFPKSKPDNVKQFKNSALVNEEITQFASTLIKNAPVGKRNYPDLINVTYYAGSFNEKSLTDNSLEIQDTYLRLDTQLGNLISVIDQKVGLNNALIVVASTGYFDAEYYTPERMRIPGGEFYPKRCVSLLNMYLMAIYGQGEWVNGYHNNQVFLNRRLIEDKQIDLKEIQTKSAEFLVQMTGVQDVVTAHTLQHGTTSDMNRRMRNGYHRKLSGDLFIEIQPGWTVKHDSSDSRDEQIRNNAVMSPLFILGANTVPQKIEYPVKATKIAPTICSFLRIRAPNACSETPLNEVLFQKKN